MPARNDGRRRFLSQALAAGAGAGLPRLAATQEQWPSRTIRIIVPIPAGGLSDAIARRFATRLSERLGQPVVVDNRPGANTMVGTVAVAKAPPDGHTLLFALTSHVQNAVHFRNIGYDPFGDFTPLARLGHATTVMVTRPGLGIASLADFVRAARGRQWTYGAYATGPQVILEVFNANHELGMTHVPYKGEVATITDIVGGQIHTGLFSIPATRGLIQSGKLVPLAVLANKRVASLPSVPTFLEQGVDFGFVGGWYAFLAPARLPADVTARLIREIKAVFDDPAEQKALEGMDVVLNWADGATFGPVMRQDMEIWRALVTRARVQIEQ
ncbi:MAG: tripartite tricarboxylate transporter substrate binding protein [Burkholderiales bacterium]|nr:tripartite tricarboxylate transporter substrate binding protein [Burkholderiales bacterium]